MNHSTSDLKRNIIHAHKSIRFAWIIGLILIFTLLCITVCNAQSITTDKNGNYIATKKSKDSTKLQWSGHTYTDTKGQTYQVYVSPRAKKLYVIKTSKKTGKQYPYYLPTNDKP